MYYYFSMNEMINLSEALEITGGSEELLNELMKVFIDIAPGQMDRIHKAAESGDFSELREAAHDVKSSASSLAAHPLYDSALTLEQGAKKKLEMADIIPMIKDVEDKIDLTVSFCRSIRESHENQQNSDT